MYCLILAGGTIQPEDALYAYTQGNPKAFIDMGGRSMLERVVDALYSSTYVEEILVVGIAAEAIERAGLKFSRPVQILPDHGHLIANLMAGMEWFRHNRPDAEVIIGCSSDIPTITGRMVDNFVEACRPWDCGIYYNFVTRERLESRFPNSSRTYSKLAGYEVAGGDMVIGRIEMVEKNRELIETLTNARKQPWRIAGIVGLRMLLKFLFHRVTFADIEATAERITGFPARVILDCSPELAMDADKPFQVEQLRAEFAQ
jgi:molybdopterin-guanine dinucleotide biosynthesis protein A